MDPRTRPPSTFAIIPVGSLEGAKSRLGAVLDAEERRELAERFVRRTIDAAIATPGVSETLVVTPDDDVRTIALELGARPLRQRGRGLNAGLAEARMEAIAGGADAIIVVPIDIPAIDADLLAPIVAMADEHPGPLVVIVPDRHDRGTNTLLLAPPDIIDFRFGGDSKAAHLEAAAAVDGATVTVLRGPLTLDIDTSDDLLLAQAELPDFARG